MAKKAVLTKTTTSVAPGQYLPPRTRITLDKEEADDKIRRGLVLDMKAGSEDKAPIKKPEGKALTTAIAGRIGELDKDNDDHFTRSGKPNADTLGTLLGYPVTGAQRDEAWKHFQENGDGKTLV